MKRLISHAFVLAVTLGLIVIAACQEKTPSGQSAAPQVKKSQVAQQSTEASKSTAEQLASQELEIVGTVVQSGESFVIVSDIGDYSVASQPTMQNLNDMVGKRVKVTATIVEGAEKQDGNLVIDVLQLSEIE